MGKMTFLLDPRQMLKAMRPLAIALAMLGLVLQPIQATAQEMGQRRNLLDMLFGGPRYERDAPPQRDERYDRPERYERYDRRDGSIVDMPPRRPRNRGTVRATAPREQAPPPVPEVEAIAKLENAQKVLVIGDFLAGNIGDELETTFRTSPGVEIIGRSNISSGLVRDDYYDWLSELPGIMDEVKPAIVVVMLGANDRQQMTASADKQKFRTDGWFKEYEARVAKLAGIVTSKKIPLLWVGLPAFQSPSMTADAVSLNAIYRGQMEKVGGEFVDIWDGFVDEDGSFVVTGSDVNGQQVRLRSADGITFTKAGKQKLAFYVEKFLRRHLGDMASPDLANFDSSTLPALTTLPSAIGPAVPTRPISLTDPELDGGKELLGGMPTQPAMQETPRDKLVKRGELDPPPAGRIDDYRIKTTQ
ncbi:hypothetical protein FHW37_1056 [Neorhizobium alkalisoli]|uniref:SGNH hydrolase-type esterase domain-containing protein n=2 Tax=Neorhizobium alkalisoli TaxID=528178 RepID=A0A561QNG6_9HYPH|nr:hypothetical protein FHW37_1056 [Neorhizobium alkalisoli]